MKFCQQLSAYLRVKEYTGRQLYKDMFEQAILCDQGGYDSVALTEHHLINILMMPAPLQFAVKIAEATKNIKIIKKISTPLISLIFLLNMSSTGMADTTVSAEVGFIFNTL